MFDVYFIFLPPRHFLTHAMANSGNRGSVAAVAAMGELPDLLPTRHGHTLMTMSKRVRTIPAGQFKARCLALLDEVATTHGQVIVTKRGRPVARLVPIEDAEPPSLLGSVLSQDDLVRPTGERWDAER